ncbi:conjugal transfer protein [Bartonella sp. B12(2025)]
MKSVKQSNTSQSQICSKVSIAFVTAIIFLKTQSVYAKKTIKDVDVLTGMHYGLGTIVPIIAAFILVFLLIIYMCRIIAKTTFTRWAFSTIIAGAAFYISHILFHVD